MSSAAPPSDAPSGARPDARPDARPGARRAARRTGRAALRAAGRLSLRGRLLALALALVVVGLVVSDTLVLGAVRGQLVQRVDQGLVRMAVRVHAGPADPPSDVRAGTRSGVASGLPAPAVPSASPFVSASPFAPASRFGSGSAQNGWQQGRFAPRGQTVLPSQYVFTWVLPGGGYHQPIDGSPAAGDPLPQLPELTAAQLASREGHPFTVGADRGGGSWRVLIAASRDPGTPAVVLATSMDDSDAMLSKLSDGFWAIGLAVVAVLAVAGWLAVWAGLRPLRRIETTATEIAGGLPLSHRMPEASEGTEVGRLARSLNSMLAQIESAFAARAESEHRMRRFVADASHELRTPLAGIRGFAELYRMGALSEERDVKRTMSRIESEAVRMGGLVEDLLTLARLDEQRPLELAPMDLRTLAADALHDTTALDPSRPVRLSGPGNASAPAAAFVIGDEARLRQVVTNLVGNAVTHTPAGTPVRIGVGTVDGWGVLEVADEGPGLTEEQATRVFERFYRVDASRSRHEGGGAGLGLAIVAALTQAHGGRVELDTRPGSGAVFRVLLPGA